MLRNRHDWRSIREVGDWSSDVNPTVGPFSDHKQGERPQVKGATGPQDGACADDDGPGRGVAVCATIASAREWGTSADPPRWLGQSTVDGDQPERNAEIGSSNPTSDTTGGRSLTLMRDRRAPTSGVSGTWRRRLALPLGDRVSGYSVRALRRCRDRRLASIRSASGFTQVGSGGVTAELVGEKWGLRPLGLVSLVTSLVSRLLGWIPARARAHRPPRWGVGPPASRRR